MVPMVAAQSWLFIEQVAGVLAFGVLLVRSYSPVQLLLVADVILLGTVTIAAARHL